MRSGLAGDGAASEEEATRAVLELASGNLDESGYTAFLQRQFFAGEEMNRSIKRKAKKKWSALAHDFRTLLGQVA